MAYWICTPISTFSVCLLCDREFMISPRLSELPASLAVKGSLWPAPHRGTAEISNDECNQHWVIIYSFLLLWHILSYRLLSIVLLMDIWIVSKFGLLWKKLVWTCLCVSFGRHNHSFTLGVYPRMEQLGQRIYKHLALIGTAKQFSLPPAVYESFSCYIVLPALGFASPSNYLLTLIYQIAF